MPAGLHAARGQRVGAAQPVPRHRLPAGLAGGPPAAAAPAHRRQPGGVGRPLVPAGQRPHAARGDEERCARLAGWPGLAPWLLRRVWHGRQTCRRTEGGVCVCAIASLTGATRRRLLQATWRCGTLRRRWAPGSRTPPTPLPMARAPRASAMRAAWSSTADGCTVLARTAARPMAIGWVPLLGAWDRLGTAVTCPGRSEPGRCQGAQRCTGDLCTCPVLLAAAGCL